MAAIDDGDRSLFARVLAEMAAFASQEGPVRCACARTLVEAEFRLRLHSTEELPAWLERGDYAEIPEGWHDFTAYLMLRKLLVEGRYREALSAGRILYLAHRHRDLNAWMRLWLKLACAECCRELHRFAEFTRWSHLAASQAKTSGSIASYFEFLFGRHDPLLDALEDAAPHLAEVVRQQEQTRFQNAIRVRNHWLGHRVSDLLPRRLMYITSRLSRRVRYRDIAEILGLSLGRVRNLCARAYQILGVHSRRELRDLVW